jgi:predicted nucleic acid-binding protein
MSKTIISDTSCFIVLSKIEQLEMLQQLFGNIVTSPEIAD